MIATWQAPLAGGTKSQELMLAIDAQRERRVLILPAWFDEANKLRRFTIETMRALDAAGVDSVLPDLPGCNESLVPLTNMTIAQWRSCSVEAAQQFGATHVLAIRAGALIAPQDLPGWHYAPQTGPKTLRAMLRARTIAAREAGREETSESLLEVGRTQGLMLAGWEIGAAMLRELETAVPALGSQQSAIDQKQLGGAGLWLRAEAGEDRAQAEALATIIAESST